MKKEKPIVHYKAEQIDEMLSQGQSQTDWERVRGLSEEDIERNADADLDSSPYPYPTDFWKDAEMVSPNAMS